jgi:hypothetical protein
LPLLELSDPETFPLIPFLEPISTGAILTRAKREVEVDNSKKNKKIKRNGNLWLK